MGDVRYTTVASANRLLRSKKVKNLTALVSFPATPVVIKQHCLYILPSTWIIDQNMLNATAEFFSSMVIVQQVKKMRSAVLVVFEDQETRDLIVKQSETSNWRINGHIIGSCYSGLPPPINKRRSKPNQMKTKNAESIKRPMVLDINIGHMI